MRLTSPILLAVTILCASAGAEEKVTAVPDDVRAELKLSPFYKKQVFVENLSVIASAKVSDYALLEAAYIVRQMLRDRRDILDAIARAKVRLVVMGASEFTTDIPEHSDLRPREYWDKRARGIGATPERPATSCAEENLLGFAGDPYATENILVHEFGHTIHEFGMKELDATFDHRLEEIYAAAMAAGLWRSKYASVNRHEYWAEGVQSWFDTNRQNDFDHNHVHTRAQLKEYDPKLAKLLAEVFGDGDWRYVPPAKRQPPSPHLAGFDVANAPKFTWPQRILDWNTRFAKGEVSLAPPEAVPITPLAPDARADWRSPASDKRAMLYVHNATQQTLLLDWMDFDGKPKRYATLRPREHDELDTFAGHVWRVSDEREQPLAYFAAEETPCSVTLKNLPPVK